MRRDYNVAIIPARGGSKSVPRKNIMPFCGRPLIAWSIEQAKRAHSIHDVYVTSDDLAILKVAIEYGAKGIIRPDEFATDEATSESALSHALNQIEQEVSLVAFIQATSPLRTPQDIDNAIYSLKNAGADSLFSMCKLDNYCIWMEKGGQLRSVNFDFQNRQRRQLREPSYLENGNIFVFKPEILRRYGNRLGGKIAMYEMPFWKSYEIDSPEDIEIVEYYFKKYVA